jgi:hypothetical protein
MSAQATSMKEQLLKETQDTFSDLYKTSRLFINEQIDAVPFEGSWTPGQVMEHMLKAVAGIPSICMGATQPAQRPQDEKTEAIKNLFLDFSIKFKSPDFIEPTETQHDKNQLLAEFKKTEQAFSDMIIGQDLAQLCLDFDLPGFGQLTRYELLHFGLIHTQRHIRQLNNILKKVTQTQ